MDHHHHFGVLVIGFALAMIAILAGFLTFQAPITGNIVALGGQITHMDIAVGSSNILWVGMYGNVSTHGGNGSREFSSGQVIAVNLSFSDASNNNTFIALSTSDNVSWNNLSPASFIEINNYMGVTSSNAFSAENTLTFKHNYTLSSSTYEVWSAQSNSLNGTYITGAFSDGKDLIFITRVVEDAYGFTNSPTDYQILFPVSKNGTVNVSFTIFNNGVLPLPGILECNASANFSAKLASDNLSVDVYWDPLPGASSYEIQYIDGPSNGFLNFSSFTNISLGTSTSWTDSNPSEERYYRLEVRGNSVSCVVDEIVGTISTNVSTGFSLLSNPFVGEDLTVNEVFRSIDGKYNEVYEFDNSVGNYNYYIIVGESVFKTFSTIQPARGYWIKTYDDGSVRFVGTLNENINETMAINFNLVGFPTISNNASDETIAHILSSIDGNYSEVYEFDNNINTYNYYVIVGNSIFKSFSTIKPTRGYWINVNESEELVYEND